jgi:hypothetical protein
MIKNIAYFPLQCAKNSTAVYNAALDVLQCSGIQIKENSMHCDAALIWSVLWQGRMKLNRDVYYHYRQQNKPVIILEIGALYRGHTWKVAVNHITRDGYYGHQDTVDMHRPNRLGISLATQIQSKPHVLIALQHAHSEQVATLGNMTQWLNAMIRKVKAHTDRPIVVRPHPRSAINLSALPANIVIQKPRPVVNSYDSFDMHFDCHAVINHNSGPGIQAAIAGVRPIVDTSSLAWPVAVDLCNIEKSYDIDRQLWLAQLCHTEYTLDEIKQGIWLKRIAPAL